MYKSSLYIHIHIQYKHIHIIHTYSLKTYIYILKNMYTPKMYITKKIRILKIHVYPKRHTYPKKCIYTKNIQTHTHHFLSVFIKLIYQSIHFNIPSKPQTHNPFKKLLILIDHTVKVGNFVFGG